jgi:hypothetical protein
MTLLSRDLHGHLGVRREYYFKVHGPNIRRRATPPAPALLGGKTYEAAILTAAFCRSTPKSAFPSKRTRLEFVLSAFSSNEANATGPACLRQRVSRRLGQEWATAYGQ